MERVIFHCDCNSFFASVELLDFPELKDKPVAVGGKEDARQGIILAKNEAAKKFKVATAETIWQAKRKCKDLIILPPHYHKYREFSKIINNIYANYSDRVEPFGIDESWLDMTGTWHLFGEVPYAVADKLRCEIKQVTGLTVSIGVSFNKVFAKLASDYKKPDAVTEITTQNYKKIVWPLPVGALLYAGKSACEVLKKMNINNIGQLAAANKSDIEMALGKLGAQLYRYACGEDNESVMYAGEQHEAKSVGNGLTFSRDLVSQEDIKIGVITLASEVAYRLRKNALFCEAVQVQIKYPDFKILSRQKHLDYPTHLEREITNCVLLLIADNHKQGAPIRAITITAAKVTNGDNGLQENFFKDEILSKKQESLEESLDKIRDKYGKNGVINANILKNDFGCE